VDRDPPKARLPAGVDDEEYQRIRGLMRVSVLHVWRANHEVVAGMDPWDVVDEAWSSMTQNNFKSKGPFLPHAITVARNKAIDSLRRVEARRRDRSVDALAGLHHEPANSHGADVDYFRELDQVAALQKLALVEEAIYSDDVLTNLERDVFMAVRVNGKSRAAVGRELDPPLTGQRVGQIAAGAFIKIQSYLQKHEGMEHGTSKTKRRA
jgi:DNA-directed RNA polymerase specialized sigma24 family protein